jgi:DNA repair protein RadC
MSVWLFNEQRVWLQENEEIYSFMRPLLQRETNITKNGDFIWVLSLNKSMLLMSLELLQNRSFEHPSIELKIADYLSIPLTLKSSYVLLVHSHENGGTFPSSEDIAITKKLQQACQTVDLVLLDHLVINNDHFFSMANDYNNEGDLPKGKK